MRQMLVLVPLFMFIADLSKDEKTTVLSRQKKDGPYLRRDDSHQSRGQKCGRLFYQSFEEGWICASFALPGHPRMSRRGSAGQNPFYNIDLEGFSY
jgi:hypothetical protein